MRHRLKGRKLGRTTAHRKALAMNLVNALFISGTVITTVEKAKEFRGLAEKLITHAKKGGLHNYRYALSILQNRDVVNKLFNDIAGRFKDRNGGYTRVLRLGGSRWDGDGKGKFAFNRLGDNGRRAIWELLVKKEPNEEAILASVGNKDKKELEQLKEKKKSKKG